MLLKTILKIENSRFYENLYSKNCRVSPVFDKYLCIFLDKIMFCKFSENINVVIFNKNRVIYHSEEKRVKIWLIFMVILSDKSCEITHKITPTKG